jgi:hypothetical protein
MVRNKPAIWFVRLPRLHCTGNKIKEILPSPTVTSNAPKKPTASRKSQEVESKRPRSRPPYPLGCGKTFNRTFDSWPHANTSNSCASRDTLSQPIAYPICHKLTSTRPDAVRRHLREKHGLSAAGAARKAAQTVLPRITIMPTSVNRGIIHFIF